MTPWGGQVISSVLVYKSQRTIWSRAIWPEANWLSCQCGWNVEFINNKTFRLQCLYKGFFLFQREILPGMIFLSVFSFFFFSPVMKIKTKASKIRRAHYGWAPSPNQFPTLMHLPASSSLFCFIFFLGFSLFSTPWYFSSLITCLELDWDGRNLKQPSLKSWKQTQRSLFHISSSAFTTHDTRTGDWWILVLHAK